MTDVYLNDILDQIGLPVKFKEAPVITAETLPDLSNISRFTKKEISEIIAEPPVYEPEEMVSEGPAVSRQPRSNISLLSRGNYSTSSESAAPIKVSGPGWFKYRRRLLSRISEYSKSQYKITKTQLANAVERYNGRKVPTHIVNEAAELYYKIQRLGEIKRKNVRKGIMAACLLRLCYKHGIYRKRFVICEILDIEPSYLSGGEKLLDRLCSEGRISRDEYEHSSSSRKVEEFLINHFLLLKMPLPNSVCEEYLVEQDVASDAYFNFAKLLIRFTNKFKIAVKSNPSSKCAGAIWVIASRHKELGITSQDIKNKCDISTSTFTRYSKSVEEMLNTSDPSKQIIRKRLKHLFNKFGI